MSSLKSIPMLFTLFALFIPGFPLAAPGGSDTPDSRTRTRIQLALHLRDGSLLIGTLKDPTVGFITRVGELPIAETEEFRVREESEDLILSWKSGDRLMATFDGEGIEIDSLIGPLRVPLAKVARGEVRLIEAPAPLSPVAVKVSGQYAHHKTEYAYDGKIGQAWSSGAWGGWIEFDLGSVHSLGKIVTHLQFGPEGQAVHDIYISDSPIGADRGQAVHLHRFSGHRHNHSVLEAECGEDTAGRYVQVHCPSSRSWFNVRELEVFARE